MGSSVHGSFTLTKKVTMNVVVHSHCPTRETDTDIDKMCTKPNGNFSRSFPV